MPVPYHQSPARASLSAAGVVVTEHREKVGQTQIHHKIFFRFGSHLNKYSAKEFVKTYIYLEYGVTDCGFFVQANSDEQSFYVTFSTDWR